MAKNRYNQYAQPYLPPQSGASYVYQPTYDESFYEDYSRIGKEKQQRFDVGRQQLSDFTGTAGAVDTFDPNALQERIGGFSDSVQEMVDTQFGGDYGLAANDIADMIAEEKGQTFYKANRFQQEQAKLQQAAQGRKRGLGESLIVQNDATQANLQDAIASGNYQEALRYQGIEAPNYDKLATGLIKDVPAEAWAGLGVTNDAEKELLTKAVGSGNIEGYLVNAGWSGNRAKLASDNMKDSLTQSMLNQAQEPLLAQAQIENPDATPEELQDIAYNKAQEFIGNKTTQLSFDKSTRRLTGNLAPDNSDKLGLNDSPLFIQGRANIKSTNRKSRLKELSDIDLDTPYKDSNKAADNKSEYNKQIAIVDSDKYTDDQKGRAALKARRLKKEDASNTKKWNDFNDEYDKFITEYGNIKGSNKQEQMQNIIDAETSYENATGQFIKIPDKTTIDNLQAELDKGAVDGIKMVKDGKLVTLPKNEYSAINKRRNMGGAEELSDYKVFSVNPKTGAVIAKTIDDKQIEFHTSSNAINTMSPISQIYTDIEDKGYAIGNYADSEGNIPIVSKIYDENTNTIELATIYVTPEKASEITNKQEARDLILSSQYQTRFSSEVNRYTFPQTGLKGTSFSPIGINKKKQ